MKVISCYTIDTPYEEEVHNLARSLDALCIESDIRGYPARGSWARNTQIKQEFIKEMLLTYPGDTLVFIDADAVVRKPLVFAESFQGNLAIHWYKDKEFLTGTLILRSSEALINLLDRWIAWNNRVPGLNDQRNLNTMIETEGWGDLDADVLPPEYVKIFDADMGDPVIEHFQASRRFKEEVRVKKELPADLPRGVRVNNDNTLWLTKNNKTIEAWLDARYDRVVKGELRWNSEGKADVNSTTEESQKENSEGTNTPISERASESPSDSEEESNVGEGSESQEETTDQEESEKESTEEDSSEATESPSQN